MKAIILTYAPVQEYEREILTRTQIFKLALNQHSADLIPNERIITDYVLSKILKTCREKIISVRERLRYYSSQVEYPNIEFKGSTIIAGLEYLIMNNYKEILIVGDNRVNSIGFRDKVNTEIDKLTTKANLYQYSNGNFRLPVKRIPEFAAQGLY